MLGESSSTEGPVMGRVARSGWLVKSVTSLTGLLRPNICGEVTGKAPHAVKYRLN